MKAPAEFFLALMMKVRRDLYAGQPDKAWFSQQKMVKKALLHPARCLQKYQIELPASRYQALVEEIIDTIASKGNLRQVGYMSRYFYFCVQQHMVHHGERYYAEGKAVGNRVTLIMSAVERAQRGADGTIPMLAQVDSILQLGKRKAKAPGAAKAPQVEQPRKIRSDALTYKLSAGQKEELARLVGCGTSYRRLVDQCASWGVKTSLGALSAYLKPANSPEITP